MSPGTSSSAGDGHAPAVAQHRGARVDHVADRVQRLLGPALLDEADDRVGDDHGQDHGGVDAVADAAATTAAPSRT